MSTSTPESPPHPPLLEMTVGGIGRRDVISIDAQASVEDARDRMLDLGLSSLVVTEREEPVGMLTRTDVLRAARPGAEAWGSVADAMTPLIASMPAETTLPEAARQMVDSRIHRVVVTYEDSDKLGLASLTDIARALADATDLTSGPPSSGLQISAFAKAAPPMRRVFLDSWARLVRDEETFIAAFEERFLTRSPFIAVRFQDMPAERVRQIIRASAYLARSAIADTGSARSRLAKQGRAHGRHQLNIDPQLHALWADCLVSTMRDLDPEYDIQVEVAWRVVLGHVVRAMSRNY